MHTRQGSNSMIVPHKSVENLSQNLTKKAITQIETSSDSKQQHLFDTSSEKRFKKVTEI